MLLNIEKDVWIDPSRIESITSEVEEEIRFGPPLPKRYDPTAPSVTVIAFHSGKEIRVNRPIRNIIEDIRKGVNN